jgi:glycosyl-4,4'-diaponeurosporenoate acyltransferase
MVISLQLWAVLVLDVAAWIGWSLLTGWWFRRKPVEALRGDSWLLRLREFETGGRWYERRLRIKRWKDRLPETGGRRGLSKRRLPGRCSNGLDIFAAECCRGEQTHWAVMAATPSFAVWNPPGLFLVMAGYGLAAGAPFVAVLRYNRARVVAVQERRNGELDRGERPGDDGIRFDEGQKRSA